MSTKPIVMVVDDEPLNITLIASMLKTLDCDIRAVKDGQHALDLLNKLDHVDLILLDIMMPGISGFEVCEIIKKNPLTKNIPIIFMTALDDEESEQKGLMLGAIDYIKKPFPFSTTIARIKNHLELKAYRDLLEQMTQIDSLSSIPNRRYFEVVYTQEIFRARRNGTPLGCLMIDIDYFKDYNDNYGHLKGDDVIKAVAVAIKNSMTRAGDFCARYGGEEFVVILPVTDFDGAHKVAGDILENVQNLHIPHEFSGVSNEISVSIGYTSLDSLSLIHQSTLVELADKNLYEAKRQGRNCIFGNIDASLQ